MGCTATRHCHILVPNHTCIALVKCFPTFFTALHFKWGELFLKQRGWICVSLSNINYLAALWEQWGKDKRETVIFREWNKLWAGQWIDNSHMSPHISALLCWCKALHTGLSYSYVHKDGNSSNTLTETSETSIWIFEIVLSINRVYNSTVVTYQYASCIVNSSVLLLDICVCVFLHQNSMHVSAAHIF